MTGLHTIRRQRILLDLDSEDDAMALRVRLTDINKDRLLPVIERVLNEFSVPNQNIKINKLSIDLGSLPLESLAEEAERRLDTALRSAIQDSLDQVKPADDYSITQDGNVQSESLVFSRLRLLEYYLVNGTLPWYANNKSLFSCEKYLSSFAENAWNLIIEIILGRYQLPHLVERLVLQLKKASLHKILYLLEPENARLILAYILDIGFTHNVHPVLPVNAQEFDRLIWLLTLTYSMRERGTQFNRQSYLKSLLYGMAQSEGLEYSQLIDALYFGVQKIIKVQPLKSTLPAMIAKLVKEKELAENNSKNRIDSRQIKANNQEYFSALLNDYSVDAASEIFSPYDNFSLLRYYLKYGNLPLHIADAGATLTPTSVTAFIHQLPFSWVRTIFVFDTERQKCNALSRLTQLTSENELLTLLQKCFSVEDIDRTEFYSAVRAAAQKSKNKSYFYEKLFSAVLSDDLLDLERFVSESNQDFRPPLASHQSDTNRSEELRLLIAENPEGVRNFLLDIKFMLGISGKVFDPVLEDMSSVEFNELLRRAHAESGDTSCALTNLIRSIPVPYRPSEKDLRSVILCETLSIERPLSEQFFVRVLYGLFPTPLSETLSQYLLDSVSLWLNNSALPEAHVNAFQAAVNRCTTANPHVEDKSPEAPDESEEFINFQNRVFSSLLPAKILALSDLFKLKNVTSISKDKLPLAIVKVLAQSPKQFSLFVREHIIHQSVREHWVDVLPESSLVRFVWLLEPQQLRALLNSAETLSAAWLECANKRSTNQNNRANKNIHSNGRRELWLFLLDFFAHHTGANCTLSAMTAAFSTHFILEPELYSGNNTKPIERDLPDDIDEKLMKNFLETVDRMARKNGQKRLLSVLREESQLLQMSKKDKKNIVHKRPVNNKHSQSNTYKNTEGLIQQEESIYINNAGLVLVAVFLPHLFKSLDLLHTNDQGKTRLRSKRAVSHAVHMLQYLVDGSTSTPEHLLVLNKILCGESIHIPVEQSIDLIEREVQLCNQLFEAVKANWACMAGTSISGLQQTFLQREGRLTRTEKGWKLLVQRKTLDVLVDQVPWRLSITSEAWMPESISVVW